jgi:hypothetical protein
MLGLNLKVISIIAGAALASTGAAYLKGRWDGASSEHATAKINAARVVAERLTAMGKSNAELKAMPPSDLCRELLRGSGSLPADTCP